MSEPLHSRLAPSASSRWVYCTSSVKFLEDNAALLPQQDWKWADEGTKAHGHAGSLLANPAVTPLVTDEMSGYVADYVKFVRSQVEPGDKLLVEQRVSLFYLPEQRGTVDVGIISPKRIRVIDLKYGAGVSVYAENNTQLATYAESLIQQLELIDDVPDETPVDLCIYQPRDRNNPEAERWWPLTRGKLREFCKTITEAAQRIFGDDTSFVANPDKQCRFCAAQGICSTYAAHVLQVIPQAEVDAGRPIVLPDPHSLTREQRCSVIAMIDGLTSWMEAVKAQETAELLAGADPIAFKLVQGKSNRQWTDEAAAEKLLRNYLAADQARKPGEVISPAQAEKLLKAHETSTKFDNRLASLITKPEGKPTLAPLADKRPALCLEPLKGLESYDVI